MQQSSVVRSKRKKIKKSQQRVEKKKKKDKEKESKAAEGLAHATWQEELEGNMFCTVCEYTVNNAVNVTQ
jgi:hypothetical protein